MVMEQTNTEPQLGEIGGAQVIGSSFFPDREYNPTLSGLSGIHTYDKMRRSDASVRASLRVVKAPLLSADWYIAPASTSDQDVQVAEFVDWAWNNTTRQPIGVLWEALLMLDYGYYAFEKVFTQAKWRPSKDLARERTVVTWKKFAPRHPLNTEGWKFDDNGGVRGLKQYKNSTVYKTVTIPIEKLLLFTLDEEAGNPQGVSILRSAYKHWYMKDTLYKIDAIQKERHGIGIPVAILPPNHTTEDKRLANELVQNLRTNEKAGVVLPSENFILKFLELTGNMVDVLASANHHDTMIKENVLANFLNLGSAGVGSRAVGSVQEDIFIKSIHYLSDLICGVFNKWAIPELVDYNFNVSAYPQMKVRRIGDTSDMRAMSVSLRNYVESNVITPDIGMEQWARDTLDYPPASQEIIDRPLEDRLLKKSGDTTNRVPKPAE